MGRYLDDFLGTINFGAETLEHIQRFIGPLKNSKTFTAL